MNENQIKAALLEILKKDYLTHRDAISIIGSNRLEKDFGITGDDYVELLEKMNAVLKDRMHGENYKGLFHPEGSTLFGDIARILSGRKMAPPSDPTIDELAGLIFQEIQ